MSDNPWKKPAGAKTPEVEVWPEAKPDEAIRLIPLEDAPDGMNRDEHVREAVVVAEIRQFMQAQMLKHGVDPHWAGRVNIIAQLVVCEEFESAKALRNLKQERPGGGAGHHRPDRAGESPRASRRQAPGVPRPDRQEGTMGMSNGWSESEKALVRNGYERGWSLKQIAVLVPGRSRNAVSGQATRMGLVHPDTAAQESPAKKKGAPAPTPQSTPRTAPTPARSQDKPIYTPVEKVKARVTPSIHKTCRWPEGDPYLGKLDFCGAACAPGYSYCVEHCLRAYHREGNKQFTAHYFETRRLT